MFKKQITLKLSSDELNVDKIAHQFVIEKTFQAEVASGMPEHIAREEMMRKTQAHIKRVNDIDEALKALSEKKAKPVIEEVENPDEED